MSEDGGKQTEVPRVLEHRAISLRKNWISFEAASISRRPNWRDCGGSRSSDRHRRRPGPPGGAIALERANFASTMRQVGQEAEDAKRELEALKQTRLFRTPRSSDASTDSSATCNIGQDPRHTSQKARRMRRLMLNGSNNSTLSLKTPSASSLRSYENWWMHRSFRSSYPCSIRLNNIFAKRSNP